jgi:exoribonuclease-2
VKFPGEDAPGHFSLAVNAYSHSTAPNRRFPDLITQRLLKAVMSGSKKPYSDENLRALATHCTEREDAASKVERFVKKCAAAAVLVKRIGDVFDAVVSGVNEHGAWVRITRPLVEGKLLGDTRHLDVGHRLKVRLVSTDAENGFIDFEVA